MPLKSIKIKNFKSLKRVEIRFDNKYDLCCIMGKNGAGKSSILDAMKYFYSNLNGSNCDKSIIDNSNPYVNKMEIEIIYDLSLLLKKNKSCFIKGQLEDIKQYINNRNEIHLKFTQFKNGNIKIYPNNKILLKFIHKNFPVYFIDTRFITLENWEIIWEIVTDISQTNLKDDKQKLINMLDDAYSNIYGDKYLRTIKIIKNILEKEKVSINQYDYSLMYKNILISRLGGDEFEKDGNKLDYYSDGLNSLNFIKLLMKLVCELSTIGLKEPIIIIDELEIGLHPQYINLLIENIAECICNDMNLIISTHSPSVITSLIKSYINPLILRCEKKKDSTIVEKMKEIIDEKDSNLFTINESYYYFSNMIVFVEGMSEIQLFSNRNLRNLFVFLNKIDLYSFNSNNKILKLTNPKNINFNIPYLILIDMDKILNIKINKNNSKDEFKINKDSLVNPLANNDIEKREKLLYYNEKSLKKNFTYNRRNKLKESIKKYKFELDLSTYSIENAYHDNLIEEIKLYSIQYNTYPVRTTIEGVLINKNNIDKVINWLIIEKSFIKDEILNLLNRNDSVSYKATMIRLILNGKLDNLSSIKKGIRNEEIKNEILKLKGKTDNKTDGWIINFIDYYFKNYINKIKNEDDKKELFKNDFPELYNILQIIKYMIK